MKIVALDISTLIPEDKLWQSLNEFGDLTCYSTTSSDELIERIKDADAIFTSKCRITGDVLDRCPNIKFVGELATGYDNIDLDACRERNVSVFYTPGYSTDAVSQHAIAFLLADANRITDNCNLTKEGKWFNKPDFDYHEVPLTLLDGMSLGIVGYGNIGSRVASIAEALGMKINIYSRNKEACMKSDYVSLHCPLNDDTYHMVNDNFISEMKDGAVLINTARGALIDENALIKALDNGKIRNAYLDVLEGEPPVDNPLIAHPKAYITPHIAWAPDDTRRKIIRIAYDNLKSYIKNSPSKNRLV